MNVCGWQLPPASLAPFPFPINIIVAKQYITKLEWQGLLGNCHHANTLPNRLITFISSSTLGRMSLLMNECSAFSSGCFDLLNVVANSSHSCRVMHTGSHSTPGVIGGGSNSGSSSAGEGASAFCPRSDLRVPRRGSGAAFGGGGDAGFDFLVVRFGGGFSL